jgi:hypothetical protein
MPILINSMNSVIWPVAIIRGRIGVLLLLLLVALMIIVYLLRRKSAGQNSRILGAIIDSINTPVLFYDENGSLAYINREAETVFEAISTRIRDFSYIEANARPDGATHYLTDEFGNGYRLEILNKEYFPGKTGRVIFVKGYAKVR